MAQFQQDAGNSPHRLRTILSLKDTVAANLLDLKGILLDLNLLIAEVLAVVIKKQG